VASDASSDGIRLYLNSGTETEYQFTDFTKLKANNTTIAHSRCQIQAVDLNYDGKKDLVVGSSQSRFYFYENTGTNASPELAAQVSLQKTDNSNITGSGDVRGCFADWNEDGGLDLLWSEYYPANNIHLYLGEVPVAIYKTNKNTSGDALYEFILNKGHLSAKLYLKNECNVKFYISTANGRLIAEKNLGLVQAGYKTIGIDLNTQPSGVYFIQVITGGMPMEQKKILFLK
jgi:hypothetical protein